LEGPDEFEVAHRSELTIEKDWRACRPERSTARQMTARGSRLTSAIARHLDERGLRRNARFLHGLLELPTDRGLRREQDAAGIRLNKCRKSAHRRLPDLPAPVLGRLKRLARYQPGSGDAVADRPPIAIRGCPYAPRHDTHLQKMYGSTALTQSFKNTGTRNW
jgi:hypothetical protein